MIKRLWAWLRRSYMLWFIKRTMRRSLKGFVKSEPTRCLRCGAGSDELLFDQSLRHAALVIKCQRCDYWWNP